MTICKHHSSPRPWLTLVLATLLSIGFGPFGLLYRQAPLAGVLLLLTLFVAVGIIILNPIMAFFPLYLLFKGVYVFSIGSAVYCAWPSSRSI